MPIELDEAQRRSVALGTEIRRLRGKMSQTELGVLVGAVTGQEPVPQVTISRWELGGGDLSAAQIFAIEEALKVPHGTLLIAGGFISPRLPINGRDPSEELREAVTTSPALHSAVREITLTLVNNFITQSESLFQQEEFERRRPALKPRRGGGK